MTIDVAFELRQFISGREAGYMYSHIETPFSMGMMGRNWMSTTSYLLWGQIQYRPKECE